MKPACLVLLLFLAFIFMAAGCTHPVPAGGTDPSSPTPTCGPVVSAEPYPPLTPYGIDPRFVRTHSGYRADPALFTEVYRNRYTLAYNSAGLIAIVDKAPLIINFSVIPGHANPNYCFFILTVRDADSGVVIGQDGYGRTFSTDNPKQMVFLSPGKYHLTLYGNLVKVDLGIRMKK